MPVLSEAELNRLAQRFYHDGVRALILTGSYATGEAGPYSDLDLLRFVSAKRFEDEGSHWLEGYLVTISDVLPEDIERWFSEPEAAVYGIYGIRQARALFDVEGIFTEIQQRAFAFVWDEAMQARANLWASQQMLGWIEEVHKGLEGLRRNDIGRLLQARFGLSWGLSKVVQVQRGILSSDNGFFNDIANAIGKDSTWSKLRCTAFGLAEGDLAPNLQDEVNAGLALYVETVDLLGGALSPDVAPAVMQTVKRILQELRGDGESGLGF